MAKTAEKIEFLYEGTNRAGQKVKGEVMALNDALAKGDLRKQGINPLRIKKKPKPLFGGKSKITPADIAIFSRQMATMMSSGVPLVQSLLEDSRSAIRLTAGATLSFVFAVGVCGVVFVTVLAQDSVSRVLRP